MLQEAYDLIAKFEGCRLKAYKDVGGVYTIGYGHTHAVYPGQTITQAQANALLTQDVQKFQDGVSHLVKVPLNNNQLSALTSFAFNLGLGALAGSHLLTKINNHDSTAADDFLHWDHVNGVVIPDLKKRRQAEQALFLKSPT